MPYKVRILTILCLNISTSCLEVVMVIKTCCIKILHINFPALLGFEHSGYLEPTLTYNKYENNKIFILLENQRLVVTKLIFFPHRIQKRVKCNINTCKFQEKHSFTGHQEPQLLLVMDGLHAQTRQK